jgi:hypothetical protein
MGSVPFRGFRLGLAVAVPVAWLVRRTSTGRRTLPGGRDISSVTFSSSRCSTELYVHSWIPRNEPKSRKELKCATSVAVRRRVESAHALFYKQWYGVDLEQEMNAFRTVTPAS